MAGLLAELKRGVVRNSSLSSSDVDTEFVAVLRVNEGVD